MPNLAPLASVLVRAFQSLLTDGVRGVFNGGRIADMKQKVIVALALVLAFVYDALSLTEYANGYTWTFRVNGEESEIYNGSWRSAISPEPTGSVTIPSTLGGKQVTSIGGHAFYNCIQLEKVDIPATVRNVSYDAFLRCPSLVDETGLVIVRDIVFGYYGESGHVELPEGVKAIGYCAFEDNDTVNSISIPSSLTYIDKGGLQASRIRSIFIQDLKAWCNLGHSGRGVDGGYTIYLNGIPLKDLKVPDGVTSIDYAFANVTCIESVQIPNSVVSIGNGAFEDCSSLKSITVSDGNPCYESVNGLLLTKDGKGLVQGVNGNVVIPDSVSKIGNCAFSGLGGLTSVVIPESVTTLGSYAFDGCCELKSITIPSGVASVSWGAFSGCDGLRNATIGNGITSIEGSAFYNCSSLMSVVIPVSVMSIGNNAFYNCALTVVYVGKGDSERIKTLYEWPSKVEFVEIVPPSVDGDAGATVMGDPVSGFVVRPSVGKTVVEVTIPQGVDAAKVTVEVSLKVASVKPNGAKVKIVSGGADITEFLNVPAADGNGVVDLKKAAGKEAIVKEAMDVGKGAKIELNAANPSLTTPNTRVGLFYQLREGTTIEGMANGDSTIGDGNPWSPEIKIKGGNSAFYSIGVGKGE